MAPATPAPTRRSRPSAADRDLAQRFAAVLRHIWLHGDGEDIRAIEESGLSFTQVKVLFMLAGAEAGRCTVKGIAERLGLSAPSASRAVDGLVREELATRTEDPDDRRARLVALSEHGMAVTGRLVAARLAGIEAFMASLADPERRKLAEALQLLEQREEIAAAHRAHRKAARG